MPRRRRWAPITILVAAALASSGILTLSAGGSAPHLIPEVGVSVYLDSTTPLTPAQMLSQSALTFSYVRSLGANAVSINFPFYEVGQTDHKGAQGASAVTSGIGTPSPTVLEQIVRAAEADGLTVQLRPLLSEIGDDQRAGVFRGTISPANPVAWFASYAAFLKPYLYVAQLTGVTSFSIGAELTTLVSGAAKHIGAPGAVSIGTHNYMPEWASLVELAQSLYHGQLLYSASHLELASVVGVGYGFDAYAPITLAHPFPTAATPTGTVVGEFEAKILDNYRLQRTVAWPLERVEEVGIPAVAGAWADPADESYPAHTPVARWVQADWITANCAAFRSLNLEGLYVWALDLSAFNPNYNADTADDYNSIQAPATVTAVRACFAEILHP